MGSLKRKICKTCHVAICVLIKQLLDFMILDINMTKKGAEHQEKQALMINLIKQIAVWSQTSFCKKICVAPLLSRAEMFIIQLLVGILFMISI